jgi:hypothetical protein
MLIVFLMLVGSLGYAADREPSLLYSTQEPSDLLYVVNAEQSESRGFSLVRPTMQIDFSGFIKGKTFFDSRQVLGFRENDRLIFPLPVAYDQYCCDTNECPSVTMISFDTRFELLFHASKVRGADVLAYLEVDFQGPWIVNNSTNFQEGVQSGTNAAVMRHAFIRVGKEPWSLLAGLYWHPLVVPESGPYDYVPFERTPFEPTARATQLRFTLHYRRAELILAALSQFDYKSNGPSGFSIQYIRDAVLPNLHAQGRFYWKDNVFGVALDYKRIVPQLSNTNANNQLFATHNAVGSLSAMGYMQFQWKHLVARFKCIYASNLIDQFMLPGYGIHAADPISGVPRFTPIAHIVASCEFFLKRILSPGIFFGITKNLGSSKTLLANTTQTGNNQYTIFGMGGGSGGLPQSYNAVDYSLEVAPRVIWDATPLVLVGEFRYIRTSFGNLNFCGQVHQSTPVSDIRAMLSLYYYF